MWISCFCLLRQWTIHQEIRETTGIEIYKQPHTLHKMAWRSGSARLLAKHRAILVRDLDINYILPQLVSRGVFKYNEEREVLLSPDPKDRIDVFISILSQKGQDAFQEFCVVLEKSSPRLLTRFLLDSQGIYIFDHINVLYSLDICCRLYQI